MSLNVFSSNVVRTNGSVLWAVYCFKGTALLAEGLTSLLAEITLWDIAHDVEEDPMYQSGMAD